MIHITGSELNMLPSALSVSVTLEEPNCAYPSLDKSPVNTEKTVTTDIETINTRSARSNHTEERRILTDKR